MDLRTHPEVMSLDDYLAIVREGGEPVTITVAPSSIDLESLMSKVQSLHLRMAMFPKGCITIMPMIPLHRDELESVCKAYCQQTDDSSRAALRKELYLRDYPLFTNAKAAGGSPLYKPADTVIKLVELCSRVVEAKPEEVTAMMGKTPYLHVAMLRGVFDAVRASLQRMGAPEKRTEDEQTPLGDVRSEAVDALQEEQLTRESDVNQYADLPEFYIDGNGRRVDAEPEALLQNNPLWEADDEETPPGDLTGSETVDHVKDVTAEYLSEKDFELVTESSSYFFGTGEEKRLAAVYLSKCLDPKKCKNAAEALQPAATRQNMRMRTNGGTPPETGIVGYYDYLTNPTQYKCRETQFMRNHFTEVMEGCAPLLRDIDSLYAKYAPEHYELQRAAIPTHFELFGTVFSTVTVNRNFRTAVHTDSGDFRSGLGVLCVVDGNFDGCHLAIKKLKKCFRLRVGDVLLFDTSLEHGNTEVLSTQHPWERVSLVCYLRDGLMSAVCELERRKHLNRLIVSSLQGAVGHSAPININRVFEDLPPLFVPGGLVRKFTAAQLSALTFVSERAKEKSGCVLAMTMGLGKTLVALTLCYSYLQQFPTEDILILVPKPIIGHWVAESKKWSSHGLHLGFLVASENQKSSGFEESLLIYKKQLSGVEERVGHVFIINPEYIAKFLDRFTKFNPVLLLVDEGHMVSSKESKLSETLARLERPLRVVLSGTPVQNNMGELYRLASWINHGLRKEVSRQTFHRLESDISRYIRGDYDAFPKAAVAQKYILDWMKSFVFREMESELPPLYDYLLVCGASATQNRLEADMNLPCDEDGNYVITAVSEHAVYHLSTHPLCYWAHVTGGYHSMSKGGSGSYTAAGPANRVQLSEADLREVEGYYGLVRGGGIDQFVSFSGKLLVLVRLVEFVKERGEKLIIFSQYIGTQDLIHRTLTAFLIPVFTVRGRDSLERRKSAMEQFNMDSNLTALILSTRVAAYGLDFTAANHVVLFDSWWNPQVDAQAVGRAYRRKQTKPVTVYRLASKVEDSSVLSVQTRKIALFNCIMREKTSRSARPEEVAECANSEADEARRELWQKLKDAKLEGGVSALCSVYRYNDSVKEADPLAQSQPMT